MAQCKAEIQVDNNDIWHCAKDGGHPGDHVSAIPENVRWSKDVISAYDRLNALVTERARYQTALERIHAITMRRPEMGQTPVYIALVGEIDAIAAEALNGGGE